MILKLTIQMKYLILLLKKTDLSLLILNSLILNIIIKSFIKQSQLLLLIKKSYINTFIFSLNTSKLTILCLNSFYTIILTLIFKTTFCSNISLNS